jgi:glycosyltransferase involved in cell wall biosynthesis
MRLTIWYITKYGTTPSVPGRLGPRGFNILKEMSQRGHRTLMFVSDSTHLADMPRMNTAYKSQNESGVEVHWVRTIRYSSERSFRRIVSWLDFEWRVLRMPKADLSRPDVIIASSLSLLSIVSGIILSRRYRCKLVFEVRDVWPLVLYEEGGFSRWNPAVIALGWIERLGYSWADIIVGTMPNLGLRVREVLGREKPTACIPMGVDEELVDHIQTLPQGYEETYFPIDKFVICHAGAIGVSNALETFFECARLMKENDKVQFLVLGEGYLKADYQRQTADLVNVTFAPSVPKVMVQSILVKCDLVYFAMQSSKILDYGQSLNKVVDYMLSGRPVVASFSGFPSMINEANCGTFVPANDPHALKVEIERYAAMPAAERKEIGARGRDWILANRRYARLADNYLRLFN